MINWDLIPYFKRQEFDDPDHPGSGDLIDPTFLVNVVRLRKDTGWPIIPHWQVGGCVDVNGTHGHAENSYHLKRMGCKGMDFHFDTDAPKRLQYYYVSKCGFSGIGVYYDWKPFGFHIDHRPKEKTQRWKRIKKWKKKKYIYFLK